MKTILRNFMILVVTMVTSFFSVSQVSAQTSQTFIANGTFTVPAGVTSIKVECWGGGGAGGGATGNPAAGGGGGGGSYVRNDAITVIAGQAYTVNVGLGGVGSTGAGLAGGDSWFLSATTIIAKGGNGGSLASASNSTANGAAARTTGNLGSTAPFSYYGGAGGTGGANGASGGGGGSSAGAASAGLPGNGANAGAVVTGGGAGVAGSTNSAAGANNANLGGGGAGARAGSNTDRAGGSGGNGKVVITYICTVSGVTATPSSSIICAGASINLSGAPTGSNLLGFSGFEGLVNYTSTGVGSLISGSSQSTDAPASTPYYSSGATGWGVNNANDATITFDNVTGLGSFSTNKKVSLRLAAFGEDASTSKGMEADDSVVVRISLDNGLTYSRELKVTGFGVFGDAIEGAYWGFSTGTGVAAVTYDGNNVLEAGNIKIPAGGGLRTTDGFSTLVISLPDNSTQVRVQVLFNTSNANESWVIDDLKVFSGAGNTGNSYSYSWTSNPVGFTSALQSPTNLTPSVTTAYTLTVSDGVCSASAVANVTVNPIPTITGASELFVASTTDLSGSGTAASSNAWVSSDPTKITVDVLSGRLKGVANSTSPVVMTYTDNKGCQKTQSMSVVSSPLVQYFSASLTSSPTNIATNRQIPYPSATYFTEGGVKKLRLRLTTAAAGVTISSIHRDLDADGNTTDVPQGSDDLLSGSAYSTAAGGGQTDIDIPLDNIKSVGNTIYNIFIKTEKGGNTFVNYLSLSSAALLPVTLTSFTAKPAPNRTVALNWATSTEIVNKGFRIERQSGNITGKYESLGFVSSKANGGNSQVDLYYNFMDVSPRNEETSYYRLAQEDLDGKTTYSEVRVVKLSGQTVSMVFPNPSNGAVNISRTADGKKMNIQVMDISGRMIQQFTNITDANYRLNISKSGMYNIKMSYPETGEQTTQRIVIER
jgi:hypothetical protein